MVVVPLSVNAPPFSEIKSFTPLPTVVTLARSKFTVPPFSVKPPPSVKVPAPLLPGESFPPLLMLTSPPI